ncbi:RING finger protein [Francisella sp. SYW-9]|uniref:RING finger protein n=1 Tax=Francisella sp. SYW-9 TaxID=2610888 RepID=UPI00123D99E1|nr:RING-H2 finger protein [Francisella sp. SYW-9]
MRVCNICLKDKRNYSNYLERILGEDRGELYRLQCGHVFHWGCIAATLRAATLRATTQQCPFCKQKVSSEEMSLIQAYSNLYCGNSYNPVFKLLSGHMYEYIDYMEPSKNPKEDPSQLVSIPIYVGRDQKESYNCLQLLKHYSGNSYSNIPLNLRFNYITDSAYFSPNDCKVVFCEYDITRTKKVVKLLENARTLFIIKIPEVLTQNPFNPMRTLPQDIINLENVINDGPIDSIDKLLEKITRHLIKVKLQDVITKSVKEYISWFDNRRSVGFFNRHGVDGKKRALALERKAYRAKNAQEVVRAIKNFFNNTITDERGKTIPGSINTNNHSFISFFLNQLKYEQTFIKETLVPGVALRISADYTSPSEKIIRNQAKQKLSQSREIDIGAKSSRFEAVPFRQETEKAKKRS